MPIQGAATAAAASSTEPTAATSAVAQPDPAAQAGRLHGWHPVPTAAGAASKMLAQASTHVGERVWRCGPSGAPAPVGRVRVGRVSAA